MERLLPNKIEAALLYDDYKIMDPEALLRLMNEHVASTGVVFQATRASSPPHALHFHGNGLTVEISYLDSPIAPDAFAHTLASAQTQRDFKEAPYAVEQHRKYIYLKITNGENFPPDPFREEEEVEPTSFDAARFDFSVSMLKTLLMIHISSNHPLAVYWAQSDRLVGMQQFLKLAIDHKDFSLMVHVQHGEQEGSRYVRTFGASTIIGSEVIMEDRTIPHEDMIAQVMHFISIVKNTGLQFPDGDTFGREESEVIRVSYEFDDASNVPLSRLVCERNEAHGINELPEETLDESPKFDLEDPAERAMHERVEQMRKTAERQELIEQLGENFDQSQFERELHGDEEWAGVRRKVDVAALRSLAGKMAPEINVQAPEKEERPKKMRRLGGLFSKK